MREVECKASWSRGDLDLFGFTRFTFMQPYDILIYYLNDASLPSASPWLFRDIMAILWVE